MDILETILHTQKKTKTGQRLDSHGVPPLILEMGESFFVINTYRYLLISDNPVEGGEMTDCSTQRTQRSQHTDLCAAQMRCAGWIEQDSRLVLNAKPKACDCFPFLFCTPFHRSTFLIQFSCTRWISTCASLETSTRFTTPRTSHNNIQSALHIYGHPDRVRV